MGAFVEEDKVKGAGAGCAIFLEVVAIGNGALMFHAPVGGFYEFEPIAHEGVGAPQAFQGIEGMGYVFVEEGLQDGVGRTLPGTLQEAECDLQWWSLLVVVSG